MTEESKQLVLENDDVDTKGFIIMPREGSAYMAKSATELFATRDEATEILAQLISKGMPIGMAVIREAHLTHKRRLEVVLPAENEFDADAPSNLIVLGK